MFRKKKKFNFNIAVSDIREGYEEELKEKINSNKDSSLSESQKRIEALKSEKSTINKKNKFNLEINKIIEENEKNILEKIKDIKDSNKNEEEKRIDIIKENKTTENKIDKNVVINKTNIDENKNILIYEDNEIKENKVKKKDISEIRVVVNNIIEIQKNKNNDPIKNDYQNENEIIKSEKKVELISNLGGSNQYKYSFSYQDGSTLECSNSSNSYINNISNEIEKEKTFNMARANFCKKNKLYDIILGQQDSYNQNSNESFPEKYKIDDKYFAFVYPNDLKTYHIIQSGFLTKYDTKNDSNNFINVDNNCKFNEIFELFFCGKELEIKTEEGIEKKKCAPNEFICGECMQKNKTKYHIKKDYFININGRVTKKNNGSYHCFGHFMVKNKIMECITKFKCAACNYLNLNLGIYFQEKNK